MVNNGAEIGNISVKSPEIVEWTIKNIFSYKLENTYYYSFDFETLGFKWYFGFYPNGETVTDSVGWISLYLYSYSFPVGVTYHFGVKKVDGTTENIHGDINWVFEKSKTKRGFAKFLQKSKLENERSELAPLDALTFTCTMHVHQDLDSSLKLETLSQNLVDMFVSQRGCDTTLKVKGETFSVHKAILSARSPVFATMFEVEMKEKKTGIADIVDCEPTAFKDFLMYLYSGSIENISKNVLGLYKIADKYDVKELKSASLISMMTHLSVENVLDVVILGHRSDISEIKSKTQDFFNKNFEKIVCSVKWESLLEDDCRLANELLKAMAPKIRLID